MKVAILHLNYTTPEMTSTEIFHIEYDSEKDLMKTVRDNIMNKYKDYPNSYLSYSNLIR